MIISNLSSNFAKMMSKLSANTKSPSNLNRPIGGAIIGIGDPKSPRIRAIPLKSLASNIENGIVVDIGYKETKLYAFNKNKYITSVSLGFGGFQLSSFLFSLMKSYFRNFYMSSLYCQNPKLYISNLIKEAECEIFVDFNEEIKVIKREKCFFSV